MKKQILLVEDDSAIRELCRLHLEREGFEVHARGHLPLAEISARFRDYEGFVLDWMLPGASGIDIVREIRRQPELQEKPVLFITARSEESDIVRGLEAGADDYIVKPFSVPVFLARVAAVLRRSRASDPKSKDKDATAPILYGSVSVSLHQARVEVEGQAIDVTPSELKLLWYLASEPGRVFDRSFLCEKIRGVAIVSTERSIDNFILSLRKKLGPAASYLESVRGMGYRFRELN